MIFYKIIIIFITVLIISNNSFSQQICDEINNNESTRIYFANGMSNSPKDAYESTLKVSDLLYHTTSYTFDTSYNANENWLAQLLEVYAQKKMDQQLEVQPEEYWYWLRNMDEAPTWFRTVYTDSMDEFRESNVYNDPYLIAHVQNYVRALYNGKRVVIVAHSQGNFYANNAYRRILNEYPQYSRNIGTVGVATPASMVHGWNNYNASIPYGLFYTTNASDVVINLVRAFYPNTLPPNPSAGYSTAFFSANHGFVDTYLDQQGPFRNRIRDQILKTISLVEIPETAPECRPVSVETLPATNISTASAQLVGKVTGGKDAYGAFIIKPASSTLPLSCYDLNIPTSGTLKAGDQFYSTVSLQPDTTYYYRACGRSGDNISSGAIISFRTNAIPVRQCGSSFVASGSSEGMEVHYNMGTKGGTVHLNFNAYQIPDKLEIWHGGKKIYATGFVSGIIDDDICHQSVLGSTWVIKVIGNSNPDTVWDIVVSCPGAKSVFDICH